MTIRPAHPPLGPDELAGLRLSHITNRAELDRWDQDNIVQAETWALRRKTTVEELLSVNYVCQLHKRMFGTVWKWAGQFRTSEKNIGVTPWSIGPALTTLLGNVKIWIEQDVYPAPEIAARFHHRLVATHPFANGNGRHARLMADLLLLQVLGQPRFSWGGKDLVHAGGPSQ